MARDCTQPITAHIAIDRLAAAAAHRAVPANRATVTRIDIRARAAAPPFTIKQSSQVPQPFAQLFVIQLLPPARAVPQALAL